MEKKKIRIQITTDDIIFFGRYKEERQFKDLPDDYLIFVAYRTCYGTLFSKELWKLVQQAQGRTKRKRFGSSMHANYTQDPTDFEWYSEMYYEPPH